LADLADYARKREFDKTPEPSPSAVPRPPGRVFCVQRHDARRLHYDLRIELGGTLKSWAVPQGPTLDPQEKRLAVLVEDHPLLYATFEGNIPAGNYGAGSMMLWDLGTWEPLGQGTSEEQLARGDFKFRLLGQKLKGEFALVKIKSGTGNKGNEWLLLKKKDAAAQRGWSAEHHQYSVASGRTQEEIAHEMPARRQMSVTLDRALEQLPGAVRAKPPVQVDVMLAQSADRVPTDGDWLFEIKWDGVRAWAFVEDGRCRLVGRKGTPMDQQYPELAALPSWLDCQSAVLDGEIATLDERGRSSFELLQPRIMAKDAAMAAQLGKSRPAIFFAFDLLYLDGYDLRSAPLVERKRLLNSIIRPSHQLKFSQAFDADGQALLDAARAQGLEGILAKRSQSRYSAGRGKDWLKIKIFHEQDFVVCGYTDGERDYFGALVLGAFDQGRLVWTGNVGTGFDTKLMQQIHERLRPLETPDSPLKPLPNVPQKVHWVRPEVVCSVRYVEWTSEQRLRAPSFVGLREDLRPLDCLLQPDAPVVRAEWLPPGAAQVSRTVEGHPLLLKNLNKVFYPDDGITKRDLLNYYEAVAELLVPYLQDRPLSLRRYPDGIRGESFFQKNASNKGLPSWMRTESIIAEDGGPRVQVIGQGKAGLLFLVNYGCIDQNPWMSRVQSLDHPDFLLIDLDPSECSYDRIVEAAHLVRRKLELLELESYPKTTGGDGLHLYVPLEAIYSYEQTKQFVEVIARLCAAERPDLFTIPRAVAKREKGKVYFDYLQNGRGKTISAPYVVRAYPKAPVATPLLWREVAAGLRPGHFHLRNAWARFSRVGDLFAGVRERPQRLEKAFEKLANLIYTNP
jgi:bifunctional non-homologous end joining protein LigD